MSEANPLVAQPGAVKPLDGAGAVESVGNLVGDIGKAAKGEWDVFALSVDGVSLGLDAISIAMNPLGELVKAGVGWLMEHVDFIREPLEVLTGDHRAIEAISQTWNNVSIELQAIGEEYADALSGTGGWGGDGALAYRKIAEQYTASLFEISEQASGAAQGVMYAGIVVGTVRAIIFDLIATFISNVIVRALLAAASSWCTLGGSIAAFIGSVVADAAVLFAKIQKKIGKLLSAIQRFVSKFNVLGSNSANAAKSLGRKSTELGREANKAIDAARKTLDAPHTGIAKKYDDYVKKMADSKFGQTVGTGADHMGTKVAKEGLKQTKDQRDQHSGGSKDDGRYAPPPVGATSGVITDSIADD